MLVAQCLLLRPALPIHVSQQSAFAGTPNNRAVTSSTRFYTSSVLQAEGYSGPYFF